MTAAHQIGDDEYFARPRVAKDEDKKTLQPGRHARNGFLDYALKQPLLVSSPVTVRVKPRPGGNQPASGRVVGVHTAARAVPTRERSGARIGDINRIFRRLRFDLAGEFQPGSEQLPC